MKRKRNQAKRITTMTKLDRLIAELCPNGVEHKTLGEIGEFVRGSGLQKKILERPV
jgi:hypothetical protein